WKTTFEPGKEPSQTLGVDGRCAKKQATFFDPPTKGSDPVVCVDWCDAQAYCAWAGKRLCGAIGGGPATTYGDPNESQWYNACSNGGTTSFPYGNDYVAGDCNGGATVAAVGTTPGCQGLTSPYFGIFDMSGNVKEWEDHCMPRGLAPD